MLTALGLAFAAAMSVSAQVPADAIFRDFKPSGDFLFDLGGQTLEHAEIYLSDRAAAYLVIAPELASPVIVNPRAQSVESVSFMKISKRDDGMLDILADASFRPLGKFNLSGQEVQFKVKGQDAKLHPKPPLLGEHRAETLRSYKPEYGMLADEYTPTAPALAALKAQQDDVRVRIYFGTWCSVCSRLVPRIIKVADELDGSKVSFEYYGLPSQLDSDPEAKKAKVSGVPTAVVYVGGKEVGRLSGGDLNAPEKAISKTVNGAKS
ncbi:MAG: thioredoxin family protein [Acidobacteriota bacterium]